MYMKTDFSMQQSRGERGSFGSSRGGGRGRMSRGGMGRNIELNQQLVSFSHVSELLAFIKASSAEFNVVNCATALQRVAKLVSAGKGGGDGRNKRDSNSRSGIDGRVIETLASCVALVLARLASLVRTGGNGLQARQVANSLWACAKLNETIPVAGNDAVAGLVTAARRFAAQFKAQELSNVLWALARLGVTRYVNHAGLKTALCAAASAQMGEFTPQGISNTAWAAAALGIRDIAFLDVVAAAAARRVRDFNAQELCNTLQAFSRVDAVGAGRRLAAVMQSSVQRTLSTFTGQNLANAVWSYAKIASAGGDDRIGGDSNESVDFASLMRAFRRDIFRRADTLNVQELSMCAWALATAPAPAGDSGNDAAGACLEKVLQTATTALRRLLSFEDAAAAAGTGKTTERASAQQLATLLWAAAKQPGCAGAAGLVQAVCASAKRSGVLATFNAQDLANTAWALARLDFSDAVDDDFKTQLADAATRRLKEARRTAKGRSDGDDDGDNDDAAATSSSPSSSSSSSNNGWPPQYLSRLLWSFAKLHWKHAKLTKAAVRCARLDPAAFNARDIADFVYALGQLETPAPKLMCAFSILIRDEMKTFRAEDLIKMFGTGCYDRAGGDDDELRAALNASTERTYTFDALPQADARVTLSSRLPGRGSERDATNRCVYATLIHLNLTSTIYAFSFYITIAFSINKTAARRATRRASPCGEPVSCWLTCCRAR
jgi:hypothetical protein